MSKKECIKTIEDLDEVMQSQEFPILLRDVIIEETCKYYGFKEEELISSSQATEELE